jgi:class 3 adenylate cyclase/RNA 3'-terminal phosphate cyclase/dephospho-CoA kinase
METKYIDKARLIAFTNTNHYEPHVVCDYWFGGDEHEVRLNDENRFKALPFAIVVYRGRRFYAAGLHGASEATPLTESLDQREVLLYGDGRGRLWFCACDNWTVQPPEPSQGVTNIGESTDAKAAPSEQAMKGKGAVHTILFTDIEGATDIVDRHGDKKSGALFNAHNVIIRAAISANKGAEIKTMGDGIMAEFPAASAAIDAAVAIQREITEHYGQADPPLRIRIGVNAGEPIADANDLHGASVILAARIMSAAAGGQILVSETVRNLVAGKPYEFIEYGTVVPKGFKEPLRLFEVSWTQEPLLILGLAGKAGSGFDSEVVDILRRRGAFEVIRTDKLADAAWELPEVRRAVAETFGKERIFDNTSEEDPSKWTRKRGVLGEIVASDRESAERLSDILNPYTTAETFKRIRNLVEAGKRHIVLTSTRLVNKEQKLFCHQTWYVDRGDEQRQQALLRDYSGRRFSEEYVFNKVSQVMRLQRDVIEPGDFPYDLVISHPEDPDALARLVTGHLRETLLNEQQNLNRAREFNVGRRRGQYVRTMLSLAQIMEQPIRLKGKKLFTPGSGELRDAIRACLEACVAWSQGQQRVEQKEFAIEFWPGRGMPTEVLTFNLTNQLSIALLVVTLIPLCLHHDRPFQFVIHGCTDLDRSSPCDYYKNVLFPLLRRMGIDISIEVEKRGFWKGDLGSIRLSVRGATSLRPLDLKKKGEPQSIKFSYSSVGLDETYHDNFRARMGGFCKEIGFVGQQQFETNSTTGGQGKSVSMSVAVVTEHSILGADSVCDYVRDDSAYEEAVARLLKRTVDILASPAALDYFTADKIMLYLSQAGGAVTIPVTDDMEHIYTQLSIISWFHKGRINIKCDGEVVHVEMDPI